VRFTNDSAILGYHAQIGVIRTFIGGEGASGIQPEGNLPEGGLQRQARGENPSANTWKEESVKKSGAHT
jgi:hypothetical protein